MERLSKLSIRIVLAAMLTLVASDMRAQSGTSYFHNLLPHRVVTATVLKQVSSGNSMSCGITTSNVLKCWGLSAGVLGGSLIGAGDYSGRDTPTVIDSGTSYKSVEVGGVSACAITSAGLVKCWGMNDDGEVGDGTTDPALTPTFIDDGNTYKQVSVGQGHACGVNTAGVLTCWGSDGTYQLGTGNGTDEPSPTVVDLGTMYKMVAAGSEHSCGITAADDVKCWGSNSSGQLGIGSFTDSPTPTVVDSGVKYKWITAGVGHTCGVTTAGDLKCWGYNGENQLGDGTLDIRDAPVVIDSPTKYLKVETSHSATCGITVANVLKCWGDNQAAAVGIPSGGAPVEYPTESVPSVGFDDVTVGAAHGCATSTSNQLWCWGAEAFGGVGVSETDTKVPRGIRLGMYGAASMVSSGTDFTCVVAAFGLQCSGRNNTGQQGDGTIIDRKIFSGTSIAIGLTALTSVSAGGNHACVTLVGDSGVCWGDNTYGQLGTGDTTQILMPFFPIGDFTTISAGSTHTCAIDDTQKLFCWGNNSNRQLGDGTTTDRYTPTAIDAATDYASVSAGDTHTCAITAGQILKCWGKNADGQIGDGTTTNRPTPTALAGTWKKVSAGNRHTCGITSTDEVMCWGDNGNGKLGDGTTTQRTSPTLVTGGTSDFIDVSAGNSHTCGIRLSDSRIMCWGSNGNYEFGDGTTTSSSTPVLNDSTLAYLSIDAGNDQTCAVHMGGLGQEQVHCWGEQAYGELGTGHPNTDIRTPTPVAWSDMPQMVSVGEDHNCAAGFDAGYCWGDNTSYEMGDNIYPNRPIAKFMYEGGGGTYTEMHAGYGYTCGLALNTLECWGENSSGQVGVGSTTDVVTPTVLGTDYSAVSVRALHTCGISLGKMYCWGDNTNGRLGDGTTTQRTSPTLVDAANDYTMVSVGIDHSCAIDNTTEEVRCWGANDQGQLGDGTTTQRTSPVLVDAGTSYQSISAGNKFTCGVTASNELRCWGDGAGYRNGSGATTDVLVPTAVDSGNAYRYVSVGDSSGCAIDTNSFLKCWGTNTYGQVGDGSVADRPLPVAIGGLYQWSSISVGKTHVCGVDNLNTVQCWGNNVSGQIGPLDRNIFALLTGMGMLPTIVDGGTSY